jgi:hypothetical protein
MWGVRVFVGVSFPFPHKLMEGRPSESHLFRQGKSQGAEGAAFVSHLLFSTFSHSNEQRMSAFSFPVIKPSEVSMTNKDPVDPVALVRKWNHTTTQRASKAN